MKKETLGFILVGIYGIICASLIALGYIFAMNKCNIGVVIITVLGFITLISFNYIEEKYEI